MRARTCTETSGTPATEVSVTLTSECGYSRRTTAVATTAASRRPKAISTAARLAAREVTSVSRDWFAAAAATSATANRLVASRGRSITDAASALPFSSLHRRPTQFPASGSRSAGLARSQARHRTSQHGFQLLIGHHPDGGYKSCGHDCDQHPTRHIAPVLAQADE